MSDRRLELSPIGRVESPLTDLASAPACRCATSMRDGTPILDVKAILATDPADR